MSNSLTAKELDLLHRIDANLDLRPLFFRKFKGLKWFDALFERGYFNPKNNPNPVAAQEEGYIHIPDWIEIEYLVNTAPELSNIANVEFAEKFLNIITDVTNYSITNGNSNYRTWWRFSQIMKYIPHQLISVEDLGVVDYWLDDKFERGLVAEEIGEKWLPILLDIHDDDHARKISIKLLEIIYKIKFSTKDEGLKDTNVFFRFDSYRAEVLTERIASESGNKLGLCAVRIYDYKLKKILKKLNNDKWSCIWHSAIEDHEQNKYQNDPENIIIVAYRDSMEACLNNKSLEAINYVVEMLSSNFETIQRIGIHLISKHFYLFNKHIDQIISDKYLSSNHRHEMWHFLNNNYQNLSDQYKDKVLELILTIRRIDDEGNYHEGATAYVIASWLSAISHTGENEKELYNKYVKSAKSQPENPDFSSYTSSGRSERISKYSLDELKSLKIDELVKTLSRESISLKKQEDISIEGLVKTFRDLIKAEPLSFYLSLKKFIALDLAFTYEILEAFRDLWGENAKLPWDDVWEAIFEFCNHVISQETFWSDDNTKRRSIFIANRYWIVGSIGRLIEAGTKSDEFAFHHKYINEAKAILLKLMTHQQGETYDLDSDAVSKSINSPKGQCITALINLALRECRQEDRENGNHLETWSGYEEIFNIELARSYQEDPEYEFATLITYYLPNFLYMSKAWLESKLPEIFDQMHYQKWLCVIQGYSYVGIVYKEVYLYMSANGDFIKALNDENIRDRVQEKIVQNIAIAYVNEYESLESDKSLINQLIKRNSYNELMHLIWFLWTLRKSDRKEEVSLKVFELWPKILQEMDFKSINEKKIASQLCHWSAFIEDLNENKLELLMKVAPYAGVSFNSYDMLKSLARLSKTHPFEVYDVWMAMLKISADDYPEEAIRELLQNLVNTGEEGHRKAREVESEFIKRGNERPSKWLQEIRKEFQT